MAWQSIREVQNQFKIESGRSGREVGDFKLRCQKGFGQNLTLKRERGGEEEQGRDIKVQIELWPELDHSELVPFLFLTAKQVQLARTWHWNQQRGEDWRGGELEKGRAEALKSTQRSSHPPSSLSLIPNKHYM